MSSHVENPASRIKKVMLPLVLKFPQGLRTFLAKSVFLTRIFLKISDVELSSILELEDYEKWRDKFEVDEVIPTCSSRILVLIDVENLSHENLQSCISSVNAQDYEFSDIAIVCAPGNEKIYKQLISVQDRVSSDLKKAVEFGNADFILYVNLPYVLAKNSLIQIASSMVTERADIAYSDHDFLDHKGRRCLPEFKPELNIDLLYSMDYVASPICVKKQIFLKTIECADKLESSARAATLGYQLLLTNLNERIIRIPKVLFHCMKGFVKNGQNIDWYREKMLMPTLTTKLISDGDNTKIDWPLTGQLPMVSIIIPTRNARDLVETCISSIINKTTYANYEIVIVDNCSNDPKAINYFEPVLSICIKRSTKHLQVVFGSLSNSREIPIPFCKH